MLNKPQKKLYEDQKDAFERFRKFIVPYLKKIPEIKEASIWASLAEGKFGTYEKEFNGQIGSDVDLVLLLEDNSKIPASFKNLKVDKSWFSGYMNKSFRHFNYHGNNHLVDILLVKPEKIDLVKERMKGRSKFLYLKTGKKSELK